MVNNNIKITFDESAKIDILSYLDKAIDSEGYIVEKNNPSQRVLTFEGEEILLEEWGGVRKGSEIFFKKNLISLMRLLKRK